MADYDLLPKLLPYLDRHLIFPLLEHSANRLPEDADDAALRPITKAKYELLKHTNMIDFVGNLQAELEGLEQAPAEFDEKRQKVIQRLERTRVMASRDPCHHGSTSK